MKVSVIVTTYNNPEHLNKVLYGLLNQKMQPDELIIADDGSERDTAVKIEAFASVVNFPVLHVWHEHKGFRAAKIRNDAIRKATGDYIILLDGDCLVRNDFVSDHLALAEKGCFIQGKRVHVSKDAVAGFGQKHANSLMALTRLALTGRISNAYHIFRLPRIVSFKNKKLKGIKSCNMSFFKNDIIAVNGFNEDFVGWGSEDSELACRFFKYRLFKKIHSFRAICFHLWHPTNKFSSGNGNKNLLMNAIASEEYVCKNGIYKR